MMENPPLFFSSQLEVQLPTIRLHINGTNLRLEVQLDDANTVFRSLLSDSTHHLKSLSKKLGSCIEKARSDFFLLYFNIILEILHI